MNVGLFLGHPAHFHLLSSTARILEGGGHHVFFAVKKKDILFQLLDAAGYPYYILREDRSDSKLGMVSSVLMMEYHMVNFLRKYHIDILVGSTLSFSARVIMHVPTIILGEDDYEVVKSLDLITCPWASSVLSPETCNNGPFERKTVHYQGFHKLAYLHPNRFAPDMKVVHKYFSTERPYFLLRFALLKAYHDIDAKAQGIDTEIAQNIIYRLSKHGDVYITSERPLEPQFEQYRLHINPLDIHHVMAYASLYIGDSQSMAVEAAMLGVPSLRINDFVGRIGVLRELDEKYELTYGFLPSESEKLYAKIDELLSMNNLHEEFQSRRQRMLADKIDVSAFFTWYIENYPESKKIMKKNPDYQYRFR